MGDFGRAHQTHIAMKNLVHYLTSLDITSKRKDVTLSILIDPRTTSEKFILLNALYRCGLVAIRKYDFNIIEITSGFKWGGGLMDLDIGVHVTQIA